MNLEHLYRTARLPRQEVVAGLRTVVCQVVVGILHLVGDVNMTPQGNIVFLVILVGCGRPRPVWVTTSVHGVWISTMAVCAVTFGTTIPMCVVSADTMKSNLVISAESVLDAPPWFSFSS